MLNVAKIKLKVTKKANTPRLSAPWSSLILAAFRGLLSGVQNIPVFRNPVRDVIEGGFLFIFSVCVMNKSLRMQIRFYVANVRQHERTLSKTAGKMINFIICSRIRYMFALGLCQYFTICLALVRTNAEDTEFSPRIYDQIHLTDTLLTLNLYFYCGNTKQVLSS